MQPRDLGPRQIEGPKQDLTVNGNGKQSDPRTHEETMTAHTSRRGNAILMLGKIFSKTEIVIKNVKVFDHALLLFLVMFLLL